MSDDSIYGKYASRLVAYAIGICRNEELSKDIVQDVFVEYFKNPPERPVASWFYRVCKNKLLNRLARENRMALGQDEVFENAQDERESPAKAFEKNDNFARLSVYLKALRDDEREAITLKYFEDFSYVQIAEIMDTTPSTVGTLIFRGMGKLKNLMASD